MLLSGGLRPEAPASAAAVQAEEIARVPGADPRIGTTLGGRYHVRRLCGEGAMGRVYEAQHIDIGRRVAIKVLHARFHHSADLVERFRREARAASKIGHPNIVDVTDSGTTPDGAFYFVMEFLDGINLEDLIADKGPLPIERALLVAAQIARALEAAHTSDIIHRDLKPANIMLINRSDEEDFVKVLDFGISKDLDIAVGAALTRPDVAIGTPAYMAPEQAAGKTADALTDVYGVGGLLYEMLTGTAPCVGEDAIDVLQRKANEDPKPIGEVRPNLPRDVQNLVNRTLARNPGDRHPNMTVAEGEHPGLPGRRGRGARAHAVAGQRPDHAAHSGRPGARPAARCTATCGACSSARRSSWGPLLWAPSRCWRCASRTTRMWPRLPMRQWRPRQRRWCRLPAIVAASAPRPAPAAAAPTVAAAAPAPVRVASAPRKPAGLSQPVPAVLKGSAPLRPQNTRLPTPAKTPPRC